MWNIFKKQPLLESYTEWKTPKQDKAIKMSDIFKRDVTQDTLGVNDYAFTGLKGGMVDNYEDIAHFMRNNKLDDLMCDALSQNYLIARACYLPAKEALAKGFEIICDEPEAITLNTKSLKSTLKKGYGQAKQRGSILFYFDCEYSDAQAHTKPYNPDYVPKKYKGIKAISISEATPVVLNITQPTEPYYKMPTFWEIGGIRFHASHFIQITPEPVPLSLAPTYHYGGISKVQQIYHQVAQAEKCADESVQLLNTKRATTIYIRKPQTKKDAENLQEMGLAFAETRKNSGVLVLGEEARHEQLDTSLSDLDKTIMTQFQLVATIAGIPATKLLGTTPTGFNSTGQYELDTYHELLSEIQAEYEDIIIRHYHLLGYDVKVEFNPFDTPTNLEVAEIALKKMQKDEGYYNMGVITDFEIRKDLIDNSNYQITNEED